jgi:hypothetical protein
MLLSVYNFVGDTGSIAQLRRRNVILFHIFLHKIIIHQINATSDPSLKILQVTKTIPSFVEAASKSAYTVARMGGGGGILRGPGARDYRASAKGR